MRGDEIDVRITALELAGHARVQLGMRQSIDEFDANARRLLERRDPIVQAVIHRTADHQRADGSIARHQTSPGAGEPAATTRRFVVPARSRSRPAIVPVLKTSSTSTAPASMRFLFTRR